MVFVFRSEYNLPSIDSLSRKRKALLSDGAGDDNLPKRLAMESTGINYPDAESMVTIASPCTASSCTALLGDV